jgi:hypothetical protein
MKDLIPNILPPSRENWQLLCTVFNLFPAVRPRPPPFHRPH